MPTAAKPQKKNQRALLVSDVYTVYMFLLLMDEWRRTVLCQEKNLEKGLTVHENLRMENVWDLLQSKIAPHARALYSNDLQN